MALAEGEGRVDKVHEVFGAGHVVLCDGCAFGNFWGVGKDEDGEVVGAL